MERTTTITPLSPPSTITTVKTVKEVVNPDVGTTRLMVFPVKPVASNSSVTTITEGPFLGIENFGQRLSLMKDQLDLGISRGWIGSADAAAFDSRYANLKSQIDLARSQGLTYELGNSLERQLNQFNIDLSQRMSTASAGLIQ
ncbi:MAG: hypothetical protein C5B53_04735 [Candidatus Melainabacteria bacterium]|nr:MAG: hypothetical protein C5B53_04735 [Candidatus Melainabacteria bacterium]